MAKRKKKQSAGAGVQISVRCQPKLLKRIDEWRAKQPGGLSRPQAIRWLAELGLVGSQPMTRRSPKATSTALDLAGQQIDKLADPSATAEERQQRKRRLLKGPGEFRQLRADLPKKKT
jgi:hypothetical protein